jgi:DNA polymerase elongation subunit (family B)
MKRYLDVWYDGRNIHSWYQNIHNEDFYDITAFSPHCYETHPEGNHTDIYGRKMVKRSFKTKYDAIEYCSKNQKSTSGYFDPEQQFLQENFIQYTDDPDFGRPEFRAMYIDIETYKNRRGGFSTPIDPEGYIASIGTYNSQDGKYTTFLYDAGQQTEWRTYAVGDDDFFVYRNEGMMLTDFVKHFRKCGFNAIVGFNSREFDLTYIINRIRIIFGDDTKWATRLSPAGKVIWQKWNNTYRIPGVVQFDYRELYLKFTLGDVEETNLGHIAMIELKETKKPTVYPMHCMNDNGTISDYEKWKAMIEYQVQDVRLVVKLEKKKKYIKLGSSVYTSGLAIPEAIYSTIPYVDGALAVQILKDGQIPPSYKKWDDVDSDGSGETKKYEGALTLDPKPGRKGWMAVFDAKSMYPSSMRAVNISPETKVLSIEGANEYRRKMAEYTRPEFDESLVPDIDISVRTPSGMVFSVNARKLRETVIAKKWAISGAGVYYRTDIKGVIPRVLEKWFSDRSKFQDMRDAALTKKHNGDNSESVDDDIDWYKTLDSATKIKLNSVYGAVGSKHSGYYDLDNALSTTITAQNVLRAAMFFSQEWMSTMIVKKMKTVPLFEIDRHNYPQCIGYGDTDSIFVDMEPVLELYNQDVTAVLVQMDEKTGLLAGHLKKRLSAWTVSSLNSNEVNVLRFAKEMVSITSVWLAPKKYAMIVAQDDLGNNIYNEKEPKLKIKGIEIVTATTPYYIKPVLKKLLVKIMLNDYSGSVEFLRTNREQFVLMPVKDVAKPSGIRDIKKWDTTSVSVRDTGQVDPKMISVAPRTPWHVKAAVYYNHMVRHLPSEYKQIVDGNKMKIICVKPNRLGISYLAFESEFPTTIGFEPDYDTQFEKVILGMTKRFFSALSWPLPNLRNNDIMSLFAEFDAGAVGCDVEMEDEEECDTEITI